MSNQEPKIAATSPCQVELEEGKPYSFCTCGLSDSQPFCDGSHAGTDFRPKVFRATETAKVWMCRCKRTGTAPFCDGTHNSLDE